MNRIARLFTAVAVVIVVVAACSRFGVTGNGVIKTETRPMTDVSKIVVSGAFEVHWSPGQPGLSVTSDENVLPHIRTVVSGDTLKIDTEGELVTTTKLVVTVSSSALVEVRVAGAVTVKAAQIAGEALKLETTGASNITVDGAVDKLNANLTGASRLNAHALQAKNATLDLNGASSADVTVSDTLKVSVTGAGTVTYSGSPKTVEKTVTGAGSVRSRP
jgi:hypothetical protein